MKTNLIIIFIIVINLVSAQSEYPCNNNTSTHFNAPYNNVLPQNPTPPGESNFGERFLNQFDWYPIAPNATLPGYLTSGIINLQQVENKMLHIYNTAYDDFYSRFLDEKSMNFLPTPDNGWELLAVNLGYFPNGEAFTLYNQINQFNALPYIILYNKHSATIRLFAKPLDSWVDNTYWSSARVIMKTTPSTPTLNANGLLRYIDGNDVALDQPTKRTTYSSLCAVNNQRDQWLSADFSIAFDPCICDYPSKIRFDFELVQDVNLEVHGGGIEIEENILNGDKIAHEDYFSNFTGYFNNINNNQYAAEGGYVIYSKMQNAIDAYYKKLKDYQNALTLANKINKEVDRKLAMMKYASVLLTAATTVATGGASAPLLAAAATALAAAAPDLLKSDGTVDNKKVMQGVEKALSEGVKHYTSSNWKKVGVPTAPVQPVVSYSEMRFSGRITSTAPRSGPQMFTPGSYGSAWKENLSLNPPYYPLSAPSDYPVYNEPLGIFALLESPKLDLSQYISDRTCNVYNGGQVGLPDNHTYGELIYSHVFQFQLSEDLKYTFNPALNIKAYSIDASIEIDTKRTNGNVIEDSLTIINYTPNGAQVQKFHINIRNNPNKFANVSSLSYNLDEWDIITDQEVKTIPAPIDKFKNVIGQFSNRYGFGRYGVGGAGHTFCQAYSNLEIDDIPYHKFHKAYLKLIINIEYEDTYPDGTNAEQVLILRYEIKDINPIESPIYDNLPNSDADFGQYPEDLYLGNTFFNGQPVNGCKLDGTTYLCKAWKNVEIDGLLHINSIPGYQVIIEAGNEIIQTPESNLLISNGEFSEFIVQIDPILNTYPMPAQTSSQVGEFCKGQTSKYLANTTRTDLQYDSLAQTNPPLEEEKAPIEFIVFPNPTTGASQAGLNLPELATVSISIVDITGKVQGRPVQNQVLPMGRNVLNLESEPLAPGVYFVQVVVNGEKLTQRLVKQ